MKWEEELKLLKNKPLRIACDGESASGKSLASKLIARKFNLYCLNSGLIYRYASFLVIKYKPKKIIPFLKKKLGNLNYKKICKLNLHTHKISAHVAKLAKKQKVRSIVRKVQLKIIKKHPRIVVEGRDTQTSILVKKFRYTVAFYFKCKLSVASYRRWRDLKKKIPLKIVRKQLASRTTIDKKRRFNALKKSPDALVIRTHLLSKKQMIERMTKEIDRKLFLKYGRNNKARQNKIS